LIAGIGTVEDDIALFMGKKITYKGTSDRVTVKLLKEGGSSLPLRKQKANS
jgi:hypothetical protein